MIPRSMVTGKLSEAQRSFPFTSFEVRISAQGSRLEYASTWYGAWRVGLPAACRGVCLSWILSPRPNRNADCNLAPQNLLRVYLNDTKLIGCYKACKKNVRE